MSFLLFLLILFFVIYLFGPLISRLMQRYLARKMVDNFRRRFEEQARGFGASGQNQAQPQPPVRKKVFTKDEGEYVEYEDIDGNYVYQSTESHTVIEESQVSDAEWEEIR